MRFVSQTEYRLKERCTINPILQQLADQVTATTAVNASAVALINGIGQRITDAVNKALENGATAEELAPVTAVVDALKASSAELATAVESNTPGGPVSAPRRGK